MIAAVLAETLMLAVGSSFEIPDSAQATSDSLLAETDYCSEVDENLLDQIESESEELEPLDDLVWREEHPYDLNKITIEELESLPGVTPLEASAFVEFRRSVRRFTRVEQLKVIEDVGDGLYQKLLPYVTTGTPGENLVQFRSRASRDLQPRRGQLDSSFIGSSLKSYQRLSIKAGDVEGGALFEKDAGEKLSGGFTSGYALVKGAGFFKQVLVGDFVVEAAQGLVLWRGSAFGKGGEAISVARKSGLSIQPYRSSGEADFFRGAAASVLIEPEVGTIEATAFLSRHAVDATIDSSGCVSGFYEAGLFRTQNELEKRKTLTEQVVGGRVRFVSPAGWAFGSTAFRSVFDKAIVADRRYEFSGREAGVLGLDAALTRGRLSAFGEIARSNDMTFAGVAGAVLTINSRSTVVLLYRDYGPGFNNLHANGFGERSDTRNERGFYFGAEVNAAKWLKFSGHVDHFQFPWQTYLNPLPTKGHEILLQSDATLSRQLDLSGRFSLKSVEGAEANVDAFGRATRSIVPRTQGKYRVTITYKATQSITAKGRLEMTTVDYSTLGRAERGYLFFQDIRYRVSTGFSVTTRLVFFDTQSYDSRLYEYESDVRGVFSNPGLYGKGRRWYLIVNYSIDRTLTLSAKYSETQKDGVTSMGSGVAEIQGSLDNRLSVQIDLAL